jgi:hypothetical protein
MKTEFWIVFEYCNLLNCSRTYLGLKGCSAQRQQQYMWVWIHEWIWQRGYKIWSSRFFRYVVDVLNLNAVFNVYFFMFYTESEQNTFIMVKLRLSRIMFCFWNNLDFSEIHYWGFVLNVFGDVSCGWYQSIVKHNIICKYLQFFETV